MKAKQIAGQLAKGVLVGAGAITPGVSGGAMALAMGVYQPLVEALGAPRRWRQSVKTLWPLALGCAAGIGLFVLGVQWLLQRWPLPTLLGFCGLVLGGVPCLWRQFGYSLGKRQTAAHPANMHICILLFLGLFLLGAALPFVQAGIQNTQAAGAMAQGAARGLPAAPVLFLAGIPFAATLLVPGLSGSVLLMIAGLYTPMLAVAASLPAYIFGGRPGAGFKAALPLAAFALGLAAGVLLLARLARWLFCRFAAYTWAAALGLLLAAPVAILRQAVLLDSFTLPSALAGAAALLLCFTLALRLGGKQAA